MIESESNILTSFIDHLLYDSAIKSLNLKEMFEWKRPKINNN